MQHNEEEYFQNHLLLSQVLGSTATIPVSFLLLKNLHSSVQHRAPARASARTQYGQFLLLLLVVPVSLCEKAHHAKGSGRRGHVNRRLPRAATQPREPRVRGGQRARRGLVPAPHRVVERRLAAPVGGAGEGAQGRGGGIRGGGGGGGGGERGDEEGDDLVRPGAGGEVERGVERRVPRGEEARGAAEEERRERGVPP
ncbi:Os07g0527750, partial [Oryza sativa Japonica Group]